MRQSGMIAAAGIIAIEEMVSRLTEDHRRAKALATAIYELRSPFFRCDPTGVHTNIVVLELPTDRVPPAEFATRLFQVTKEEKETLGREICVKLFPFGAQVARAVVHRGIGDDDIEAVTAKLRYIARELELSGDHHIRSASDARHPGVMDNGGNGNGNKETAQG